MHLLDGPVDGLERRDEYPAQTVVGLRPDVGHEAVVRAAQPEFQLRVAGEIDDEEGGVDDLHVHVHLVGRLQPVGQVLQRLPAPELAGQDFGIRRRRLGVVPSRPGGLRDQPPTDDPPVAREPRGRLRGAHEHRLQVRQFLVEELPDRF